MDYRCLSSIFRRPLPGVTIGYHIALGALAGGGRERARCDLRPHTPHGQRREVQGAGAGAPLYSREYIWIIRIGRAVLLPHPDDAIIYKNPYRSCCAPFSPRSRRRPGARACARARSSRASSRRRSPGCWSGQIRLPLSGE
jgi:hypothetical protein